MKIKKEQNSSPNLTIEEKRNDTKRHDHVVEFEFHLQQPDEKNKN